MSILGGKPRKLRGGAYRAEVSPDASLVAYMKMNNEIWLADADGENPRPFIERDEGVLGGVGSPKWSPDGRRLVYKRIARGQRRAVMTIESRALEEEEATVLVSEDLPRGESGGVVWASDLLMLDDRLVYVKNDPAPSRNNRNLWELAIDPRSGKPRSEPRQLTDWVGFDIVVLSTTADGSQLAFLNDRGQTDVFVGELLDGGRRFHDPRRLTLDDRNDWPEAWTPDSSAVVFRSDRYGNDDLFVQALGERDARELVTGADDQFDLSRTPDGKSFLYWELEAGNDPTRRLLRIPVGGGPAELVLQAEGRLFSGCATAPDGPCLLFEIDRAEKVVRMSRLDPVQGKGQEIAVRPFAGLPRASALSPDGLSIAWVMGSEPLIHIAGAIDREIEIQFVPSVDPTAVAWWPDGKGFYVVGESDRGILLLRVDMQGQADLLFETGTGNLSSPTPSPDGRHLAFAKETGDANAWMIEQF